ncbi:hypothetical protein SAMN05444278_10231 [Psychroflexus salarius]|uniref:Uncharacterized protein n=1 Tax=Psychroflexus salarius TaxID=1155689 RepID=A0A1M4TUK0_9FLAO|nr:hypothetical protein [Psychroflexus salarius]SHE48161.1 hypothetical protein SAMN05444278_10231 [Psychroflexus salarius]
MKKVLSIIALSAMTLSLSSFSTSKQATIQEEGNPTDCNRQARLATYHFAHFVFGEEASGSSENNDLYVAYHNAVYESCLAD